MKQESVRDYPRLPRALPTARRIRVKFAGEWVADSVACHRVLESGHPPVYYIPAGDVRLEFLTPSTLRTICEFKGTAVYWSLRVGDRVSENAAWSYPEPARRFRAIAGHLAFYANRVDDCMVDDERVIAQPGDFYGGWITSDIAGPFKR